MRTADGCAAARFDMSDEVLGERVDAILFWVAGRVVALAEADRAAEVEVPGGVVAGHDHAGQTAGVRLPEEPSVA